ncbi:MAG: S8 family serine peptidase [Bacteroidota bacterium]
MRRPILSQLPYWEDAAEERTQGMGQFDPEIDGIIVNKFQLPYRASNNYRPKGENWSKSEIRCGFNRIYRLIIQRKGNIPQPLIDEIRLLPQVAYIREGGIASSPLPDRQYSKSSSLTRRYRNNQIGLQEAHLFTKGNPDIKIAILDTGFEDEHPEIRHTLLPGKDFVNILDGANQFIGDYLGMDDDPDDEVGHGTHVAGIIGAKGLRMPLGVVPNCKIIPVKVLGALKRGASVVGAGLIDNINNGIKWAVDQEADVINMSLGIKHLGGGLPHEEVIEYALEKGVSVVAASGNDGSNDKYYPGALPGVIAVGAADDLGQVAPFSTFGGHVSLIAPGVNIYSSYLNNQYVISSGTSQAAPFVAGAIGLLKSFALKMGNRLHNDHITYLLKHTSDRINLQWKDGKAGYGLLNILDALKLLQHKLS